MTEIQITPEQQKYAPAVRVLNEAAFPTPVEAELVELLHRDGDAEISLVALAEDKLVGHVMFSRMNAPFKALGMAPVAVDEGYRKQGIAAKLIEEGIARAKSDGWDGIFVLGDPAYYSRFGYSVEAAAGFENVYAGPYLMFLWLGEGEAPKEGAVEYAKAFSSFEE